MKYAGHHILVLGTGRSGRAAAELLLREGASVTVYDQESAALGEAPEGVERVSGNSLPDFGPYDAVVQSPGVPVAVDPKLLPEVDLAAELLDAPIVGVTGTNGKSTTGLLITEMLGRSGLRAAFGGNIGTPLTTLVGDELDWVVAELSSFQLEHARRLRARVAVLLNLAPDHLDRHGDLAAYGAAKARLAELQGTNDTLVANRDDAWARDVARRSPARILEFSTRESVSSGACLDGDAVRLVLDGETILRVTLADLSLASRSPVENALAACAAAHAAGATPDAMRPALAEFAGLPHRAELVCTRGGVDFIDDSKATNPAAAAACLGAQTRPVWWLAGGRNKGLDFAPLAPAARRARGVIVYGEAAAELDAALAEATRVVRVDSLDEAVRDAAARATPGDVVLLSPACASQDQFGSFEERGAHFAELARALPC